MTAPWLTVLCQLLGKTFQLGVASDLAAASSPEWKPKGPYPFSSAPTLTRAAGIVFPAKRFHPHTHTPRGRLSRAHLIVLGIQGCKNIISDDRDN